MGNNRLRSISGEMWSIYIGIFLVSLATISIEMFLNRMFSLTYWYHFAFLIISIALFGIGVGGVVVFFINPLVKRATHFWLFVFTFLLAIAVVYCIQKINTIPLETNLLGKSEKHNKYFQEIFLTLAVPFVLSGMVFSIIFTNYSEKINSVYFADLIGGGIGCFFVLWLFPGRGPIVMSGIVSIVLFIAAISFILFKYRWYIRLPLILIGLAGLFYMTNWIYPTLSEIKVRVSESKRDLDVYGPVVFSHWDNFSYVAAHNQGKYYRVFGDYAVITPYLDLQRYKPQDHFAHYRNQQYPFILKRNADDVFIVGAGGGREIMMGLIFGAKNMDAIEFNPTFYYLLKEKFKEYTGNIVDKPGVNLIMGEARHYIKATSKKYDLMIFNNAISLTAANSGANALSESFLFTVEAFMDYISKLKPNGVIFLSNPYPDVARFLTVIREAFKRLGKSKELRKQIMVSWTPVNEYRTCKIMIKNGDFTEKEVADVKKYIKEYGHELLYAPFNTTGKYEEKLILTNNIEREYLMADNEIRPSTDNWPFFMQRVRLDLNTDTTQGLEKVKWFYPQPFLIIKAMSETALTFSLLFLILPLVILNLGGLRRVKNKIGSIVYFMSLGLGFMLVEIIFMQKFVLFLGHPMYAFSVVLATILITSGIGSLVSKKGENNPYKTIAMALGGLMISIGINIGFFLFLSDYLIGFSFGIRLLVSIVLIGMAGFFMGFFMPMGIQIVSKGNPAAIPWMWAINGVFSVLAGFMSVYLATQWGFNLVLLCGIGVYILGTAFLILKIRTPESA